MIFSRLPTSQCFLGEALSSYSRRSMLDDQPVPAAVVFVAALATRQAEPDQRRPIDNIANRAGDACATRTNGETAIQTPKATLRKRTGGRSRPWR